ncbi:MAG: magnesium transporter CorA family protein [bacterium]|nr:magnesium transporter CorA family protein [bacterium]
MVRNLQFIDGNLIPSDQEQSPFQIFITPTTVELQSLVDRYGIDSYNLSSALDPDELSRFEYDLDARILSMILKEPTQYAPEDEFFFKVTSIGIFLTPERLIIVAPQEISLLNGKLPFKLATLNDVMLRLIYEVINHFLGHLKVINVVAEDIEDKISASMDNKYLLNLFTLEKSLVYILNGLNQNAMVLEKLRVNARRLDLSERNVEILEDIAIENNQALKQSEIYSNILSNLMDARVSIVSNNLNIIMKRLTILTVTIMLPTFVVSAFSMNVKIPLSQLDYAWPIIVGFSVLAAVIFLVVWRFWRK